MRLEGHGIAADLPAGWEGALTRAPTGAGARQSRAGGDLLPTLHLANFPLPRRRGDYGATAVERMTGADVFVALVEFGGGSAGAALFADTGLPRRLHARQFSRRTLHRALPGQAGYQTFFTEAGRPFCLYVVLGAAATAPALLPAVNAVLPRIRVARR